MTRNRKGAGPRPTRPPAPPKNRLGRLGTVALIALPLVVAALLLRPSKPPDHTVAPAEDPMLDSLVAADARKDRVSTLIWAERLGAKYPLDHDVLLARGTAWNDYSVEQRGRRVLMRPALRTSLERMEGTRRALGLMDSSARATKATDKWISSMTRQAEVEENLGLPGEALVRYELVKARKPGEVGPMVRAYWLRALLYDPVHPDTSEWDRRMKSLHMR